MKSAFFAAFAVIATVSSVAAQSTFPDRPVRMVVPAAAGGGNDIIARLVAQRLNDMWGQTVIVENKTGGGGNIAGQFVARSKPDGYTLLVTFGGVVTINPYLYNQMGFDPIKDLDPIINLATAPYVLAINPKMVPSRTVKDFIELVKASPVKMRWGGTAKGSPDHLAGELFAIMANVQTTHVPYKGGAEALLDVLGDRVPFGFFTIPTSLAYLKSGQILPLGVSDKKPSTLLSEVLPLQLTLPGYEVLTWYGVWAPAGTPTDVINKINADMKKVIEMDSVRQRLVDSGFDPAGGTPAEFAAYVKKENEKYGEIISKIGIQKN
jgi:tripartite-type tricarboxylate transporter receptor subunit TctC